MLTINCARSEGQGRLNEDVVGHIGGATWVIDGATGVGAALLDEPSDAAWFARRADAHLRRLLAAMPERPTADLLRETMSACRDDLSREAARAAEGPHEHPSAAIAMVRSMSGAVELTTLGDCRIAFIGADGEPALFGTTALDGIERRTIALAEALLEDDPDLAPDALKEALLPQLRANRRMMNVDGGYWVLGTEPEAANHLDRRQLEPREQSFGIASDGFLRLVEVFAVASPGDLLAIEDEAALSAWMTQLRSIEAEPGSCRNYPRVKVYDDASFVHCRYRPES